MTVLVDVYPINFDETNYPLSAYTIDAPNADEVGGVFAYKTRSILNCPAVWVKREKILVTPSSISNEQVHSVLTELWSIEQKGFEHVNGIKLLENWESTSEVQAQFVAIGILGKSFPELKETLKQHTKRTNIVISQRKVDFKGIVVDNRPAIQITVSTSMESREKIVDLEIYKVGKLDAIINIGAKCKNVKGVITSVIDNIGNQREKLRLLKPTSYDSSILDTLPDNHPIVGLKTYTNKTYNYPLAVLKLHLDMGNLNSLKLSPQEIKNITGWLKIPPHNRKILIDSIRTSVADYLNNNFSHITLGQRFNSNNSSDNFNHIDLMKKRLRFANGTALVKWDSQMLPTLERQGIYRYAKRYENDKTIRIGVIDVVPHKKHLDERNNQLGRIITYLAKYQLEVIRADTPINIYEEDIVNQRIQLQAGLNKLVKVKPDIVLIYLPESDQNRSNSDDQSLYNIAKIVCVGNGIPSQVIYENTLFKTWKKNNITQYSADDNIIMGILGKTGNIPYVLAEPIQFADVIVGLDVSRELKKNAPGTMSFAALSRIYTNEGALIGFRRSSNMAIPGEIIPQRVLESILPESEFSGKRVVVHRDGKFVGEELTNIMQWGEIIGAKFLPIEVTKSGVARMYLEQNNEFLQAKQGSVFQLSDNEAYLASTPPPSGRNGAFSTSRPLRIANFSDLSMDDAIYSVTALTLLHYGSTRATRLPVSIHASDKIAGFLRRNITPQSLEGDVPFWL